MSLKKVLKGIITGVGAIADGNIMALADKIFPDKEAQKKEREAFILETKKIVLEEKKIAANSLLEEIKLANADKDSARDMYEKDNWLQKVFGVVFLVAYVLLSCYIIYLLVSATVITTTATAIITMVFTGMSTKLNTIVDFLYGGSLGSKKQEEQKP